ncbi:MAG: hypothetical protein ACI4DU_10110 [Lachnospiraceae bacterium]
MNLRRIGGVLLSILGILLTFICVATIVKIVVSGNREPVDIQLVIVMIIGTILGLVMLVNGCRLLESDKLIKLVSVMKKFLGNRIIFVIIALLCICGLFVFSKKYKWICMMVGNISVLIYGALKGWDFKNSGKWEKPWQLERVIGAPVLLYWIVVCLLMEYVIGW